MALSTPAWRLAAANRLRASGQQTIPDWYDGSDAASQRLSSADPTAFAAVRFVMQQIVLERPGDFAEAQVNLARSIIAQGGGSVTNFAGQYTPQTYGVGAAASDFAGTVVETIPAVAKSFATPAGWAEAAATAYAAAGGKVTVGGDPAPSAGMSWGLVVMLGLGAGLVAALAKGAK